MPVALGLAGSGLLIFYYIGVLQSISQAGFFVPGQTPIGGLSGGGITAIQTCAGVPFQQQLTAFKKVLTHCQTTYSDDPYCGGKLGSLIKDAVLTNLKTFGCPDAHSHCGNRLLVSVSELDPLDTSVLHPWSWTISNFTSVTDMVDIVGATCFLPCFMAPQPYTTLRNRPVMDGGFTSGYAEFCPSGPGAVKCIKVSAYQVGPNNPTGHGPNCSADATAGQAVPGTPPALVPRDQWRLPSSCTYNTTTQAIAGPEMPPFVPADSPDIFPGNSYNYLDQDPCVWQSWALSVLSVTPAVAQYVHDQGVADASAWLHVHTPSSSDAS